MFTEPIAKFEIKHLKKNKNTSWILSNVKRFLLRFSWQAECNSVMRVCIQCKQSTRQKLEAWLRWSANVRLPVVRKQINKYGQQV